MSKFLTDTISDSKVVTVIIFVCLLVIIALRFLSLQKIPIFWDEAIYLNLSEEIIHNPLRLFNSFEVVQFPMMIWFQAIVHKVFFFIEPLLLGRILMAIFDLTTSLLVFGIGKRLSSSNAGFTSMLIYLTLPLSFFHGRLVMTESLACMFAYLAVLLGINHCLNKREKKIETEWSILLSVVLILSFVTKPLVMAMFIPIFFIPLFFPVSPKNRTGLSKFIILDFLVAFFITVTIVSILSFPFIPRFSVYLINEGKDAKQFFQVFKQNLWRIVWWTEAYLTLPVIVCTFLSFFYGLYRRFKNILWLHFGIIAIITLNSIFAGRMYPRHIYLLGPLIALTCSLLLDIVLKRKSIVFIVTIALIFTAWIKDTDIAFQTDKATIALEDKQQFFEDWSSGVGTDQIVEYLSLQSKISPIIVYSYADPIIHWSFTVRNRFQRIKLVEIDENQNLNDFVNSSIVSDCLLNNCYLIMNKHLDPPTNLTFVKVFSFPKGPNRTIDILKYIRSD